MERLDIKILELRFLTAINLKMKKNESRSIAGTF